jgi:hypothetical protein
LLNFTPENFSLAKVFRTIQNVLVVELRPWWALPPIPLPAFWYREDARKPQADFAFAKLLKLKAGSKLYYAFGTHP